MRYESVVATATNVHPAHAGRSQARPRNGDLDFFEELAMTALFTEATPTAPVSPLFPQSVLSSPTATSTTTLAEKRSQGNYIQHSFIGASRTPNN